MTVTNLREGSVLTLIPHGRMKLIHVSEEVTDVLAVTGMIDILTIE